MNFASSYDDVLGLAVWCVEFFVGLRTAGTGFLRALLYPMPIAGGEPEAALEIVVAGMVGGLVDDVIDVWGGVLFVLSWVAGFRLLRLSSEILVDRSIRGMAREGFRLYF